MGTWGDLGGFLEELRAALSSQAFSPALRSHRWNHSAVQGASEPGTPTQLPRDESLGSDLWRHADAVYQNTTQVALPVAMEAAGLEWAETPLPCAVLAMVRIP